MATKKQTAHDHDHDHDEHDHDHDHDHDHEHEELTEEEMAEAEADVARMGEALAALDDEALGEGLSTMSEKSRGELAGLLNLPRATMHLGDALPALVRRKLRNASPDRQLQSTFLVAERVNDATIEALGDRSEDPSYEDLVEVLPGVLEAHNHALATAMLAGYAASDAKCRPVMRRLLDDDERFVIGEAIEIEEPGSSGVAEPEAVDEKAMKEKREARKAAKDAKRAAELRAKEAKVAGAAKRRAAVHASRRKKG